MDMWFYRHSADDFTATGSHNGEQTTILQDLILKSITNITFSIKMVV